MTARWPLYPIGVAAGWFAVAQGCAVATSQAEPYVGLQASVASPTNTHNDDEHEASSETVPGVAGFVGWSLRDWLAVEVRGAWWYQRAHGYNPDGPDHRESTNGTFQAVTLQACPVLRWPDLPVEPYARVCAGPGYSWIDTTRSSVTGRRSDDSGVVLAYEGAAGVEIDLSGIGASSRTDEGERATSGLSVRLEGGYASADPIEQFFGGIALVYRFNQQD